MEQEFLERCFQEMLEEEDQDWFIPSRDLNNQGVGQLQQQLNGLSVSDHHSNLEEVAVSRRSSFSLRFVERSYAKLNVVFLFSHLSAEEEPLESRSEGVRPGEEILGVPLTPMEPPHAHTQTHTSPHIFSETLAATTAHTLILLHTRVHTHTHTLT